MSPCTRRTDWGHVMKWPAGATAILPLTLIVGVGWVANAALGDDSSIDDKGEAPAAPVSYWREIRPIFQARCQGCHQPAKSGGEYVMTDFEALLAGGESGEAAIVPGKIDESYMIDQITPYDGEAAMPQGQPALSETELQLVRRWIEAGAQDDTPASARSQFDMQNPPTYAAAPVITSLDFSPDGSLLATSGYHEVLLHRIDTSKQPPAELVARLVGMSQRIEDAVFSPDGTRLAVAGGSPGRFGELQVWDVAERSLLVSVSVSYDTCYGASWSPDGKLVAIGCPDNAVRAFETDGGQQVLFNGAHNDWVLDTVFSKDGSHLVTVSRDRSMKLIVVKEERFVDNITSITPGALKGGLHAVDRHPAKDELVVGGADGLPKIFRMFREKKRRIGDDYNLIRKFDQMPGRVFDIAYSPDGTRVVAGSSHNGTGTVNVYNADDGKRVATMEDVEGGIYAVAMRGDGKIVASGGFEGTVFLHHAGDGQRLGQFTAAPIQRESVAPTEPD